MKTKIFSILLLIGLFWGNVYSQNINKAKLDSLFDVLSAKNKAMGSLAISKNGNLLYSRAIGYSFFSDSEKKNATTLTKYRIGSITKMFTATMILQLVEEEKLKLTTTIGTYFPQLPNADKITITNLLRHRSGLFSYTEDSTYITWMSQPKTQEDILAIISKEKVEFEPNKEFSYSNSNYFILGCIIEKITNKSYSKNLNERIASKIGLANTYYGGKTNLVNNESFSYQLLSKWEQAPETDMSIPGGAGSIVSTPSDLTKFIESLFSGKLISANSLAQMKTMIQGYGMGMIQFPFYEKKAFGHTGGIDGFASNLAYFPEDSLAVAYITNGQVYPLNDILIGALSACFNKQYSIPTFNTIALKTEILDKYLGVYASTQMPLKITITRDNTSLFAQATGQSSFPLEPTEENKFKFDQAGVQIEFNPDKKELLLKQGGGNFLFTKNKE